MTFDKLVKMFPKGKLLDLAPYWDHVYSYAYINTPKRVAMFLAQTAHESQGFTRFQENLNYSAKGLASTWPSRYTYKTPIIDPKTKKTTGYNVLVNDLAKKISNNPVMIANYTYANRYGNGDVNSGDGWKYRGRGLIMTTFKDNYIYLDNEFEMNGEIVSNPDLLINPEWALKSALSFWKRNNINKYSDLGDKGILLARKKINGGIIGLKDVENLYKKIIINI